MSASKKPLQQAVEVAVFAPLGFALEVRKLIPTFVERGRNQVMMTRMIGQFAVQQGQKEATKRLGTVQDQAEALLSEFGLGSNPGGATVAPPMEPAAPTPAPAPAAAEPAVAAPAASSLPIADYDSLAASQVIPRLSGLSAEDLAAVAAYEQAHRGRKTILGKLAQLSGE